MALGVSKTVAGTPSRAVKVGFWPAMASIGLAVGLYVAVDRCLMPCPATPQKRFGVVQEAVERRRFWQRSAGGQLTQGRALAVGYLGILAWKVSIPNCLQSDPLPQLAPRWRGIRGLQWSRPGPPQTL